MIGSQIFLQPISRVSDQDADRLVEILNEDQALRQWLGMEAAPPLTREEFRRTAAEWQQQKHAQTFVIYANEVAVGTISISHILPDGTARLGYWLAGSAWGQGIGAAAFALVIEQARRLGVRRVSATTQIENLASRRIWQKWGADEETLPGNRVRVTLSIQDSLTDKI